MVRACCYQGPWPWRTRSDDPGGRAEAGPAGEWAAWVREEGKVEGGSGGCGKAGACQQPLWAASGSALISARLLVLGYCKHCVSKGSAAGHRSLEKGTLPKRPIAAWTASHGPWGQATAGPEDDRLARSVSDRLFQKRFGFHLHICGQVIFDRGAGRPSMGKGQFLFQIGCPWPRLKPCPALCATTDCSPPGPPLPLSSPGENRVSAPFHSSKRSFRPRARTCTSCISCLAGVDSLPQHLEARFN